MTPVSDPARRQGPFCARDVDVVPFLSEVPVDVIGLAAAILETVDRHVPGWQPRARRRLARVEAILSRPDLVPARRDRLESRARQLRALLGD